MVVYRRSILGQDHAVPRAVRTQNKEMALTPKAGTHYSVIGVILLRLQLWIPQIISMCPVRLELLRCSFLKKEEINIRSCPIDYVSFYHSQTLELSPSTSLLFTEGNWYLDAFNLHLRHILRASQPVNVLKNPVSLMTMQGGYMTSSDVDGYTMSV